MLDQMILWYQKFNTVCWWDGQYNLKFGECRASVLLENCLRANITQLSNCHAVGRGCVQLKKFIFTSTFFQWLQWQQINSHHSISPTQTIALDFVVLLNEKKDFNLGDRNSVVIIISLTFKNSIPEGMSMFSSLSFAMKWFDFPNQNK